MRQLLQALVTNQEQIFGKGGNPAIFKDQYDSDLKDLINGNATDPSKTVTADYGIKQTDHTIYIDSTSGAVSSRLPRAISNKNKTFIIMKVSVDNNIARADVTNDGLINGFEGAILTSKSSITVKSNGTLWYIVSSSKDVDTIVFEEFLAFSDDDPFLFSDGTQFITQVVGN